MCADRNQHDVKGIEFLSGRLCVKLYIYIESWQYFFIILYRTKNLTFSRRCCCQMNLSSHLICFFKDGHIMPSLCRNSGCLKPSNSSANNCNLFHCVCRLNKNSCLISIFCIKNTGNITTVLDGIHTALITI